MEIIFKEKALEELYEDGSTKDHKYNKLPNDVVKRYCKVVNYLRALEKISDLYSIKSLHYEKKMGTLKGIEVVWITQKYRLLFNTVRENNELLVSALLFEISKHYE